MAAVRGRCCLSWTLDSRASVHSSALRHARITLGETKTRLPKRKKPAARGSRRGGRGQVVRPIIGNDRLSVKRLGRAGDKSNSYSGLPQRKSAAALVFGSV